MVDSNETVVGGQPTGPAVTEEPAPSAEPTVQSTEIPPEGAPAPAETPPVADAAPATNEDKRQPKAEHRIGQLTARAKSAEEREQTLQAENTALQQQLTGLQPPDAEQFEYGSPEHTAAVVAHAAQQGNLQGSLNTNAVQLAQAQNAVAATRVEEVRQQAVEFAAKTPDYAQTVGAVAHLPNVINDLMQLDNAPGVYYALGKNPTLAAQLEGLAPGQRLVELGKLSAQIQPPPVTASEAPPPIASAQGGTVTKQVDLGDPNLSDEAWHAQNEANRVKRAQGG